MIAFAWNVLLALAWVMITGGLTLGNVVAGFLLGYAVLAYTQRTRPEFRTYFTRPPQIIGFVLFFLWDLIKSNLRVARDVLTPRYESRVRPGVIGIALNAQTNAQITILANLITVTPGTLSIDVSNDRKTLYIHAMYLENEQELRAQIEDLERRVIEIMS